MAQAGEEGNKLTTEQRAAFFQLSYDQAASSCSYASQLLHSKATNGPLMFWSAAIGKVWDDGCTIFLDGVTLPSDQPPSGSPPPDTPPPPEIERGPVYINEEDLVRFRRGDQRSACAQEAAKTWLPAWTTVAINPTRYMDRTKDKYVQQIIKETADQLERSTCSASGQHPCHSCLRLWLIKAICMHTCDNHNVTGHSDPITSVERAN
ncbi:hypothetical protein FOA52_014023 [Chlamydomonas sp. UWO 241]|nr:hypothetical protein FOA52_014023 [Chlamydomonas sp. UWO 241]